MKKYIWICLILITMLISGCSGKEEESIPLVSDTVTEEEGTEEIQQVDSQLGELEFAVQDQLYKLPIKYEEAAALGWIYSGDETEELDGESYIIDQMFTVGDLTLKADITNFEVNKLPVSECYIGSVIIDMTDVQSGSGAEVKVALAEQIVMQESTIVHAEDAYGPAKDKYEGEDHLSLTYEFGLNKRAVLTFDATTEILTGAELCNRQNLENEEGFKGITDKATEEVKQYQKPENMSDDFKDFIVSYGGILYRLPAPVSEFIDSGWELQADKSDPAVKAGRYGYVTLSKDGQNLYAVVYNSSEESVRIKNCFVTSLYGDITATKVPIGVAKGIVLGMDMDSCLDSLKEVSYSIEEDDEKETVTYYIYGDQGMLNYTAVTVDQALKMVSAIRVVHYPEGASGEGDEITKALENIALVQKGN